MTDEIASAIAESLFFSDFLLFLKTIKEKGFLGLTKTGNLKRQEIDSFGSVFKIDIYHRDEKGNKMWGIWTEDEVPHLIRIRLIAKVMNLTYQRKDKLLLSKNGQAYLVNIDEQTQFEQMVLWYFNRCNWGYQHCYLDNLAELFQDSRQMLWQYFQFQNNQWLEFKTYVEGIRSYFHLALKSNEYHDHVEWAVERVIIKDLQLYGLLEYEETMGKYSKEIRRFKVTPLGEHIFSKALSEPF